MKFEQIHFGAPYLMREILAVLACTGKECDEVLVRMSEELDDPAAACRKAVDCA